MFGGVGCKRKTPHKGEVSWSERWPHLIAKHSLVLYTMYAVVLFGPPHITTITAGHCIAEKSITHTAVQIAVLCISTAVKRWGLVIQNTL